MRRCSAGGRPAETGADIAARDIHNVGDHGRCRRRFAGAAAFEEERSRFARIRDHSIECAVDVGERRAEPHHGRLHALIDAFADAPRDAEQLDAESELARESDVLRRDVRDALDVMSARSGLMPKARLDSSASLCAVSPPPTSSVGSASA